MRAATDIQIDLEDEGEWQRLVYRGPINEDAKAALTQLVDRLAPRVILDLGGVSYLNSSGIRDWSYFIKTLRKGRELVLDRCADEVVRTMNMVISFHGNLPVRSVFRVYGCPRCHHEQVGTFVDGVHYKRGEVPQVPAMMCEKCGEKSEPFESDEEFFSFLV
jgi:anti-anti-sigma regulatory factor